MDVTSSAPPPSSDPGALVPEDPAFEAASYHTAMAHLYRGEMNRLTVWRTRLDTTSHWAIILSIGLTTFTLGSASVPHYVMLLALAFNTIFMVIEGRRYQHLHHSKWRLNLIEHNYFAPMLLDGGRTVERNWRLQLATDLRRPHFTLTLLKAARLRLRRNYLMVMAFVTAVWIAKLFIHPRSPGNLWDFYARLSVEDFLPSWFVAVTAVAFIVGTGLLAALTPSEEELERWSTKEHFRRSAALCGCPPETEPRGPGDPPS
jgi:uncharacterized membrane protein